MIEFQEESIEDILKAAGMTIEEEREALRTVSPEIIKEMEDFTELEEGRSNISHSNTILARAGPCFQQINSLYSSSRSLTSLWIFHRQA